MDGSRPRTARPPGGCVRSRAPAGRNESEDWCAPVRSRRPPRARGHAPDGRLAAAHSPPTG
eukprot:2908664-Alexandrium_andersonii.AAC.1